MTVTVNDDLKRIRKEAAYSNTLYKCMAAGIKENR
jgi:hypothetical protein